MPKPDVAGRKKTAETAPGTKTITKLYKTAMAGNELSLPHPFAQAELGQTRSLGCISGVIDEKHGPGCVE